VTIDKAVSRERFPFSRRHRHPALTVKAFQFGDLTNNV
jgi:hypothetical protein